MVSTVLYILVSLVMTGDVIYNKLNVPEAMSFVLITINQPIVAQIISAGAILGILAVILAFIYASSNIAMAMSRGGFLPKKLAILSKKGGSPNRALWLIGVIAAVGSGFLDLKNLATFSNVGSICVFALISLNVMVLRKRFPNLKRPFKVPLGSTIPVLAILICIFLLTNLPLTAWLNYLGWLLIGAVIYFTYSMKHVIY